MITNKFGELIYNDTDVIDAVMSGRDLSIVNQMLVDSTVSIDPTVLKDTYTPLAYTELLVDVEVYDQAMQSDWHMPQEYKELDIAQHVLDLCTTQAQIQRVGRELLMYQERNLFNLLRYLKYLVDTMQEHNIVWGVGRGSSVASYVLYLLKVHDIDSMYYDLDIDEFLR